MKRKFALLLACALAFALLAGCQAKPAGEPAAEAMRVWLGACADVAANVRESMLEGQALLEQARIAPPKARISVARTAAVKPQAVAHALAAEAAIKDEWIRWHKPVVLPPVQTQSASRDLPYYIMVNRAQNTVTVYTKDADGNYTVPFKAMVCSTGRPGCETPTGEFSVMSFKAPWCYMIDGSYGQYSTGFREGGYLFHSICYTAKSKDAMMMDEYNMLGSFASAGCVRLQVADAKWIYDNCAVGTGVLVYDGDVPGPLGKPQTLGGQLTEETYNGWDPSDPDPENPWLAGN